MGGGGVSIEPLHSRILFRKENRWRQETTGFLSTHLPSLGSKFQRGDKRSFLRLMEMDFSRGMPTRLRPPPSALCQTLPIGHLAPAGGLGDRDADLGFDVSQGRLI